MPDLLAHHVAHFQVACICGDTDAKLLLMIAKNYLTSEQYIRNLTFK